VRTASPAATDADIPTLIRTARRKAALTQAEVAQRARTAQSAVAAYESAARTPNLDTLERLLGACEHDIEIVVTPRMRRGAASLADPVPQLNEDLAVGEEHREPPLKTRLFLEEILEAGEASHI
jgi:transcriptional regulator with XRE-family HTH domain